MEIENRQVRTNGFNCPLSRFQILSWLLISFKITIYYALLRQIQTDEKICSKLSFKTQSLKRREIELIFYTITAGLCIVIGAICTASDPTDPIVYQEKLARQQQKQFKTDASRYCLICQSHVQEDTKHCGMCNRCVCGFDHHCTWINNCVGSKNYILFVLLVCSLLAYIVVETVIISKLFADYNADLTYIRKQQYVDNRALLALLITSFIFNPIIIFYLIVDILLYHFWLYTKGLTTYEHILLQRQQEQSSQVQQQNQLYQHKSKVIQRQENTREEKVVVESGKANEPMKTTGRVQLSIQQDGNFSAAAVNQAEGSKSNSTKNINNTNQQRNAQNVQQSSSRDQQKNILKNMQTPSVEEDEERGNKNQDNQSFMSHRLSNQDFSVFDNSKSKMNAAADAIDSIAPSAHKMLNSQEPSFRITEFRASLENSKPVDKSLINVDATSYQESNKKTPKKKKNKQNRSKVFPVNVPSQQFDLQDLKQSSLQDFELLKLRNSKTKTKE